MVFSALLCGALTVFELARRRSLWGPTLGCSSKDKDYVSAPSPTNSVTLFVRSVSVSPDGGVVNWSQAKSAFQAFKSSLGALDAFRSTSQSLRTVLIDFHCDFCLLLFFRWETPTVTSCSSRVNRFSFNFLNLSNFRL